MIEYDNYGNEDIEVEIVYDENPESPREWDCHLGTMYAYHSRYNLGDKTDMTQEKLKEYLEIPKELYGTDIPDSVYDHYYNNLGINLEDHDLSIDNKPEVVMPLFLYDHSILSISTCSYVGRAQHANWDSMQVGYYVVTNNDMKAAYGKKEEIYEPTEEHIKYATNAVLREVEEYDTYLRGEVFGYIVKDIETDDILDTCFGFYDIETLKEHADLEYWVNKKQEKLEKSIFDMQTAQGICL